MFGLVVKAVALEGSGIGFWVLLQALKMRYYAKQLLSLYLSLHMYKMSTASGKWGMIYLRKSPSPFFIKNSKVRRKYIDILNFDTFQPAVKMNLILFQYEHSGVMPFRYRLTEHLRTFPTNTFSLELGGKCIHLFIISEQMNCNENSR